GDSAVVARLDGSVHLLDLWPARQRMVCELNGRSMALDRAPSGAVVVVAMADGRIEMRSVDAPERSIRIFSTQEQPTFVAVSSDHRYVAVGTAQGTVEVW